MFILNGYNATIQTNPQSTISDRKAFTGNSNGFINSKIDLTQFTGTSIDIRFRFSSDGAAAEEGWYIDDIALEDIATVTNSITVNYDDKVGSASTVTFISGNVSANLIEINSNDDFEVYPNPVKNTLYFNWSSKESYTLEVFDINGKLQHFSNGIGLIKLPFSTYKSGVYIIEARSGSEVIRKRIIKE